MNTPERKRSRRSVLIAAVIGLIVLAVPSYLLLQALSPEPDLNSSPDEAMRVTHPDGFSIIIPRRMKASIYSSSNSGDPSSISVHPDGGHSRYTTNLNILSLGGSDKLDDWKQNATWTTCQFQNQPAISSTSAFGEYTNWSVMFTRDAKAFRISVSIPDGGAGVGTMPPPAWIAFLETFRVEAEHGATTQASRR